MGKALNRLLAAMMDEDQDGKAKLKELLRESLSGKVRVLGEGQGGEGPASPPSLGGQSTTIKVERSTEKYWKRRGWRKKDGKYVGYYRTPAKSYRGEAEKEYGHFKFYIYKLPSGVKRGSHSACFRPRKGGKYFIHFNKKPKTLSSGIIFVEKLLRESTI